MSVAGATRTLCVFAGYLETFTLGQEDQRWLRNLSRDRELFTDRIARRILSPVALRERPELYSRSPKSY